MVAYLSCRGLPVSYIVGPFDFKRISGEMLERFSNQDFFTVPYIEAAFSYLATVRRTATCPVRLT